MRTRQVFSRAALAFGILAGLFLTAGEARAQLQYNVLSPCRVADTRGNGFTGQYGPPAIAGGGTQRTFVVAGQCGVPSGAAAVALNFTVWAPVTRGDLRVFPAGIAAPTASALNWEANILALANTVVVPLGTGGSAGGITVQVDGTGTINLFFDVEGYVQ